MVAKPPTAHSHFREGFAALWHEPLLLVGELTWRWCFGFSALALAIISIALFLKSLTISPVDELLLHSFQPILLGVAGRHIFRGSLSRLLVEQGILLLGLAVLWAFAATTGRAATLRRLVAMFASGEDSERSDWHFASIFVLQFLRAVWSLIASAVGAGLLVYGMILARAEHPLRAALVLSFGTGVAWLAGLGLRWYLGVAPLFCIRNGAGAMDALDQTVSFSARHAGRLSLLGLSFDALRLVWFGTMFLVFLATLGFAGRIGAGWTALLMCIVVLVYFAGVDLLYLARLGSYVSLSEDDAPPAAAPEAVAPPDRPEPTDLGPVIGLA